jgi:hypothetical protein
MISENYFIISEKFFKIIKRSACSTKGDRKKINENYFLPKKYSHLLF